MHPDLDTKSSTPQGDQYVPHSYLPEGKWPPLGASLSLQGLSSAFSSGDLGGNQRECVLSAGLEGSQADQQTNGIQGMGLDSPFALLYVGWGEKQTQTNDPPTKESLLQ